MSWISRGDLLRVNGKVVIAHSGDYTKMVYDDYDREIIAAGGEGGSAVGCVNVMHTDTGIVQTIRFDMCKVEKVGREFP